MKLPIFGEFPVKLISSPVSLVYGGSVKLLLGFTRKGVTKVKAIVLCLRMIVNEMAA